MAPASPPSPPAPLAPGASVVPHPICYELRITVADPEKDALVELLHALGESEFVEGAVDCDVEIDFDPEDPPMELYESLSSQTPLVLYSEDLARLEALRSAVAARAEGAGVALATEDFHLAPIADQDWRESWRASFRPVDVKGVFVILPPWEVPGAFPHAYTIVIDPGMAFGTGQHETTRLCLGMLLDLPHPPRRVLDVGTGSGILAIAARLYGAEHVVGNDIDPESVRVAEENAAANGVSDITFSGKPLEELPALAYDLVFANIQFEPLVRLLPAILERAPHATRYLFSGILASETEEFARHLETRGLRVLRTEVMGHWTGLCCEKPGARPD